MLKLKLIDDEDDKVIADEELENCLVLTEEGYFNNFTLPLACFEIQQFIIQEMLNDMKELAGIKDDDSILKIPGIAEFWKSNCKSLMNVLGENMELIIDELCGDTNKETLTKNLLSKLPKGSFAVDLEGLFKQLNERGKS